jgi:hypothetical protein
MGELGGALRKSVQSALPPPREINRGYDIYLRVSNALHKAEHEDGTLTSPEAFGRTLELLNALPDNIPLPQVFVESDSNVGLDWDEGNRRVVSLTIRDTPMIGFAALFGAEPLHGRMAFTGEVPQTLRFLLTRLFPTRT